MVQAWTETLTFEDLVTQLSKELTRQQRRSSSRPAADFLGPGMSSLAVQVGNWDDPITLLNGNYYSEPGSLHSPDDAVRWTGSTIAKSNGSGMQQVWNTDDLDNIHYWMRTYVDDGTGQGAEFSDWRNFATPSGYVEFGNIDPAYTGSVQDQIDAVVEGLELILPPLKVYRQTTAPTNPDGVGRDLMVGDQWLDTDDGNHPYIWDGTVWADYADLVLGDIPAQIAAAQAAAEDAAAAAADAFDFALTLTKVYRQSSPPSDPDPDGRALVENDVWFDSDDDNRPYYFDGASWVEVQLATESYADAQAAAAQVAAIAAAAADATTKAGAAQSAAISAAASDATTKAAAAQAAAIAASATDATTKANAAQAAAIAAAAADATTKAGAAQSAAIAAAATDATTKAAAAQAAAIAVANTKAAVFRQSATPTSLQAGDIWFDTGHDNAIYRAFAAGVSTIGSSAWVLTQIGLTAIADDSITSAKIVAGTIQTTDLVATAIDGMTVTGATLQTTSTAARGIKINSTGLTAYNGSGVATLTIVAATGAITMLGDLTSGSTITGATVTGGTIQSEATAARGVKITSGGLTAYNASGVAQVTIDATTGSVTLAGALTGAGTITGPTFQTTSTGSRGIKISSAGLTAYTDGTIGGGPAAGTPMLVIDATTGAITMRGDLTSGSSITGATVTGGTVQSEATAARGVKITSGGLTAYNSSGVAQFTIDATTGSVALAGSLTGAGTITGPMFQTSASANTGIKISSSGLIGYNGTVAKFTLNASTGVLTLDGGVLANGSIDGAVVTGGTLQTEATAARGIKINSSGLAAYNTSGVAQFTVDASTGALVLVGSMTGGGSITGPIFQTTATAARGVKITSGGLTGYDSSGVAKIVIDASTGAVTIAGALTSGSTIDGATVTGGTIQTSASASTGIKLNSSGLVAYGSGVAKLAIDATTGSLTLDGTVTGAGTITGPTYQTSSTGQRMVIDGPGDIISFYSGVASELTPGTLDPGFWSGFGNPNVRLRSGTSTGAPNGAIVELVSGNSAPTISLVAGNAQLSIQGSSPGAGTVSTVGKTVIGGELQANFGITVGTTLAVASTSVFSGDVTLSGSGTDLAVGGHITATGTGWLAFPFAANYVSLGGGFMPGQYKRVGNGVKLRGSITRTVATAVANSTAGTMPSGTRPTQGIPIFEQHLGPGRVRVDVYTTGEVKHADVALTVGGYLCLDGIEYDID